VFLRPYNALSAHGLTSGRSCPPPA
jgi:hypothetical protein